MSFKDSKFEVPSDYEEEESVEKKERLVATIAEYQRDRTNTRAREEALAGIKERTLLLSKEEYERYIEKHYAYLSELERRLRKKMGAFSHTPETRAVLNKDELPTRTLPYVRTHEEVEILEDGPFPSEQRKWEETHNDEEHPQECINPHVEATYEEYRHAKREGNLDVHHADTVAEIRRLMEEDKGLEEMMQYEEKQRNAMYQAVKIERNLEEKDF